jgi:hypothetical protein
VEAATTAADTLKFPLSEPCGIVTVGGTVTAVAGLADTPITAPPAGAAAVSVRVHTETAGDAMDTGVQVNPLSPGWTVTVPPVLVAANTVPVAVAATLPVSCNADEESEVWLIGRVTVATTPLAMVELFNPHRMQVADPELLLQETCLFAAAAAGPAAIVAEPKSSVE